jgi:hypothetical protein
VVIEATASRHRVPTRRARPSHSRRGCSPSRGDTATGCDRPLRGSHRSNMPRRR